MKVQIGAAVSVPDCSTEDNAASLLRRALSELGWSTPQIWDVMDRPISDVDRCVERGIAALEREGYRTIQYVNRVEDPGSISYVPLRPGQVEILNQRPVQAGDL